MLMLNMYSLLFVSNNPDKVVKGGNKRENSKFPLVFCFYWGIVALQCCVSFWSTTK